MPTKLEPSARYAAAMFTSREPPDVVLGCAAAALRHSPGPLTLDIVVNGAEALSKNVAERAHTVAESIGNGHLRVWYVPMGDKAHAINTYIHRIVEPSEVAFFIDGYARVDPGALTALADALDRHPAALGATGVPTRGLSARRLRAAILERGGIHGNLYALRGTTILRFRQLDIRLPLGLYRTDPSLGAFLAYNLDPGANRWKFKDRMVAVPAATWDVVGPSWWHPSRWDAAVRRRARQAQGELENGAMHHLVSKLRRRPDSLPATTVELIQQWAASSPEEFKTFVDRRSVRRAWDRLQALQRLEPGGC